MLFSNPNIKTIFTHQNNSPIINIFHLNFNDDDHFLFLSDDGLIKEYSIKSSEKFEEIDKCNLLRPNEEILTKNNHPILKFKNKDDYIHLTKTIIYDNNFLGLGYEDGLVLVYSIERQNKINKKEELEEINENTDSIQNNDSNNNNNNNDSNNKKNYYNAFSLYYILLGHSQKISALAYYDAKKYFITASDACLVKIFSTTSGYSLYHFNLDCIINNILIIEKKTNINLIFLCEEPYKLNIDITNEPFSFNHYTFRYNNINGLIKVDKKFFLLGTSNNIFLFNENFDFNKTFSTKDKIDFDYFINFGNKNFIVIDGEYFLRFCELKDENINFIYKFKLSNDNINCGMIIYNKFFLSGSQDGNVYLVDIEENIDKSWEIEKMNNEDKESAIFNEEYAMGKNKKKKKDKDGKDKEKKKKGKKK